MNQLQRGDRVVLLSSGECGVVIHTWLDRGVGDVDCYVAFFGEDFPDADAPPARAPYVLRYAQASLRRVGATT